MFFLVSEGFVDQPSPRGVEWNDRTFAWIRNWVKTKIPPATLLQHRKPLELVKDRLNFFLPHYLERQHASNFLPFHDETDEPMVKVEMEQNRVCFRLAHPEYAYSIRIIPDCDFFPVPSRSGSVTPTVHKSITDAAFVIIVEVPNVPDCFGEDCPITFEAISSTGGKNQHVVKLNGTKPPHPFETRSYPLKWEVRVAIPPEITLSLRIPDRKIFAERGSFVISIPRGNRKLEYVPLAKRAFNEHQLTQKTRNAMISYFNCLKSSYFGSSCITAFKESLKKFDGDFVPEGAIEIDENVIRLKLKDLL